MDRCTACRGRLATSPVCPRCGCDFTLAFRAESQSRRLTRLAIQSWTEGNPTQAADYIRQSLALKHGRIAETMAAILQRTSPPQPLIPNYTGMDRSQAHPNGGLRQHIVRLKTWVLDQREKRIHH